jgi:methionyl-tRNA synthetase
MPRKAEELWQSLGAKDSIAKLTFNKLDTLDPTGWNVRKGAPLFPKRETAATA